MNIQTLQTNNKKRMSSREMADLCNKPHDNVLKLIRSLVEKGIVKNTTPHQYTHEQNGQQYTHFLSDQRDSLVIVARLSPEFTAAVIDRWQELEAQASAPVIPATLSEALRLAADQAELIENQQSRLALTEPKAAALDVIDCAIGSLNVRDTAKALGIPQNKFVNWCLGHDWMYRDKRNKLKMSSIRMKQGFMEERAVTYQGNSNERVATTQPLFTPKGLTHLAKTFAIVHEVA
ncbi:phage antirepressor KilAC domain-containing protein [Psychrobacter sp. Rd 27.2]|uniref:phage antirepressor KilAC domain-containing protein n=1 Tax=Psychrobacter sp. Rd 27.2 TaxID=1926479 RepID=UPI0009FA4C39|nr:phage antirepressor KilAC domain-containing protein [Psychrobacter sp. Rd 27.2]